MSKARVTFCIFGLSQRSQFLFFDQFDQLTILEIYEIHEIFNERNDSTVIRLKLINLK